MKQHGRRIEKLTRAVYSMKHVLVYELSRALNHPAAGGVLEDTAARLAHPVRLHVLTRPRGPHVHALVRRFELRGFKGVRT